MKICRECQCTYEEQENDQGVCEFCLWEKWENDQRERRNNIATLRMQEEDFNKVA